MSMYNIKMVITDESKWVSYGNTKIHHVFGANNNTSGDVYIQFHAAPVVLAGDVPAVASLFAPAAAPFDWPFTEPIDVSELTIAVSSTQATYTALTNTGLDLTAIIETDCPVGANTTLVGDLTTGVTARQVWSEASGLSAPKRLLMAEVKNTGGIPVNIFIGADDSVAPSNSTMKGPFLITAGATKKLNFGRDGISPRRQDGATLRQGASIYYSEDLAGPVFTFPAGTAINARAIYDV